MSDDSLLPVLAEVLVWDASPLHHAIKAERIDTLSYIAARHTNVTTAAVVQELEHYHLPLAGLDWLRVVHVDGLGELIALVEWMNRVGGSASNQGEATVLAWAQVHGGLSVVDDQDARSAAKSAGAAVCGSLRVIAAAVAGGRITRYEAGRFVDELIDTGARYPCRRGSFVEWALDNKLINDQPMA